MPASNSAASISTTLHQRFAEQLAARDLSADPAQQAAFARLAEWLQRQLGGRRGWLRRHSGGVYLWGGVGRGKSLLLDCFFAAAPLEAKRRVHFHAFLQDVQQRLLRFVGQPDPLALVARELAGEVRLLCFDEFHVHDIGDAILLGRLLQHLLHEQVGVVLTSNYPPAGLCPNPLYHERFQPFIRLLQQRLTVLELDGGRDYRPLSARDWGSYCWPVPAAETHLAEALGLTPDGAGQLLAVNRLRLQPLARSQDCLWLAFAALFEVPSATADYLWLCRHFACLAISAIPPLDQRSLDVQQRFLNFVDIAYDSGVQLLLGSAVSLDQLCVARAQADFARTRSRLAQLRQVGLAVDCDYRSAVR